MFLKRAVCPLATLALVLTAGSCSKDKSGSDASGTTSTLETAITLSTSAGVAPSDAATSTTDGTASSSSVPPGILAVFDASSPERYVLGAAVDRLTSQCMERAGFAAAREYSDGTSFGGRPFWEANFGLFDEANASLNGYQMPSDSPGESGEQSGPELTPEYIFALEGNLDKPVDMVDPVTGQVLGQISNRRGCVGEAIDGVYGSFEDYRHYISVQMSLQQSAYDVLESVRASEAYNSLTVRWSECMSEHGYSYTSVFDPARVQWPSPPSQLEVETAKADVSCKAKIEMKDGIASILASELEPAQNSMSELFNEFATLTQTYMDRAEATG